MGLVIKAELLAGWKGILLLLVQSEVVLQQSVLRWGVSAVLATMHLLDIQQ